MHDNLQTPTDSFTMCSAEYMRFMRKMGQNMNTDDELVASLMKEFPPLGEKLRLGYLVIYMSAPKSMIAPDGQHTNGVLYGSPDNIDMEQEIQAVFQSGDNGTFTVLAYPKIGVQWSEAERDYIHFICENLFMLCGRSRMSRLLQRVISTDSLTGVLNMGGFIKYGVQLGQMGWLRGFDGIFLNLKNFKYINQTVGQHLGDEILVKYCRTIMASLREDERMGRPGGDNFVLLVRKENTPQILKMLHELPVTVSINGHERVFPIAAHVGAYNIQPQDDIDRTLNCATIALNVVKRSGTAGDQLWYHPEMKDRIMHEKQISQLFTTALRTGEFLVYYQPKVTLENRTLCGCEALCRWYHNGEIVPPMDFIPVLEKEGTVCDLDFYVFERVCKDIRDWLDRGIEPVRVSVNFSQQHLQDHNLAKTILRIMQQYNVDSKYIEVELTEMSGAKNHDAMLAFLQQMRSQGISTSIDDFGTGYSSLNMLREFQMDIIKLDKSFLDRITLENIDYRTDEIIVENIVRMAQSLNLEIISEGVETSHQAEFLKSVHCNMAQGYLFDKPLPHDIFENRLSGNRQYDIDLT